MNVVIAVATVAATVAATAVTVAENVEVKYSRITNNPGLKEILSFYYLS